VKLVKVNIDEERELAERYGIVSIPTMVLFKDGEQAAIGRSVLLLIVTLPAPGVPRRA